MSAHPDPLDPTGRLLVRLSRVVPAPAPLAEPPDGVDWPRLERLAGRLGNFALIARRLLPDGAPAGVRERLERNLDWLDLRARLLYADLAALATGLDRAGEPVVLLKGGAYDRFIYPRPGLRSFTDLDVLVRPEALEPARRMLRSLGYRERESIEGSVDMIRAAGAGIGLLIELHTGLVHHHHYPWYRHALRFDERRMIERAEPRRLDGAPVRVLCAADELLYSVLHFFYHHDLEGLRYHSDLNALLADPRRPLDPEAAVAAARGARAGHAVGLALLVQERLFGAGAVPASLLDALAPRGPRLRLLERLLGPLDRLPLDERRRGGHPVKVLVARGVVGPLQLGLRWLFPGKRFLMTFYGLAPGSWRAGYRLRYPAAIVRKGLDRARGRAG